MLRILVIAIWRILWNLEEIPDFSDNYQINVISQLGFIRGTLFLQPSLGLFCIFCRGSILFCVGPEVIFVSLKWSSNPVHYNMFAYISKQGGRTQNKGNFLVTSLNNGFENILVANLRPTVFSTCSPFSSWLARPPLIALCCLASQFCSQFRSCQSFTFDDHWSEVMIVSVIGRTLNWALFRWKMFAILVDICPQAHLLLPQLTLDLCPKSFLGHCCQD